MKNVLFITYFFPPAFSSGVFRPTKFVKYLSKHGNWNPIVLTLNPELHKQPNINQNLLNDIPSDLEIYYVNSIQPNEKSDENFRKFYHEVHIPDAEIGSLMHFVIKGLEIINSQKIDLIYCTIPPFTLGTVGTILKNVTGVPLVVDYRDGWATGNDINKYRSKEGVMLNSYFESEMLKSVDGIITVDEKLGEIILKNTSNIPMSIIPNGYDTDDLNSINRTNIKNATTNKYTIVCCGFIYTAYETYLKKILQAIASLVEHNMNIEFIIAGDVQNSKFLDELKSYDFVNYLGGVPFEESLDLISNADINLVVDILSTSAGSKFYNLLLANRYIFSLVNKENEFIRDFLEDYPYKTVLPLESSEEKINESIIEILELDKTDLYLDSEEVLERYKEYDREYNTYKLESFFIQVLNSGNMQEK
ncbi:MULTISPECIES: glycosyltransferase [Psychrobacillus]|uniref:glycosyltransferase n=1 Tax=Psychrobacillus TaxID=1221880 RepID=UPI0008E33D79|nr:glycosyltransferase [Psychrobacillus psychrodurans]MCZ8539199.1 glycosyltransferase [Psychrobacillus psychrodurans]SFM33796.1 Glycosyltransferase involved in cell wall bisynthesis [Psychrobacillus psychrodurans]